MSVKAGTAYVDVLPELSKFQSRMREGMYTVGTAMVGWGKKLTRTVTLPILGVAAASLKAFGDQEEAIAKVEAVLRSTKGVAGVSREAAIELSESLMDVTTYADEDILALEALLLTFTKIRNEAGESNKVFDQAVEIALDMSSALGQDLKASAIQLGKALQDPVLGMTAMRRVGVNFNAEQKEMVERMVESGDLLGAQKFILRELATEFGGMARKMAKTSKGQLQRTMNQLGEIGEEVGAILMPFLREATKLLRRLVKWWQALNPEMKKFIVHAGLVAAALGPLLWVGGKLVIVLSFLSSAIIYLVKVFVWLARIASALFGLLMAHPLVALAVAVVVLVTAIILNWGLVKRWTIRIWNAIWDFLVRWWDKLLAPMTGGLSLLVGLIVRNWGAIQRFTVRIWNAIKTAIMTPVRWIKNAVVTAFDWVKDRVSAAWRGLQMIAWEVWDGIRAAVVWAVNLAINAINALIRGMNKVSGAADWVAGPFVNWGNIPEIPTLARGAVVTRPTFALIGERGPEAVIPLSRIGAFAGREIRGELTLTPDGRAFIRAVVAEEIEDEAAFRRSLGRSR